MISMASTCRFIGEFRRGLFEWRVCITRLTPQARYAKCIACCGPAGVAKSDALSSQSLNYWFETRSATRRAGLEFLRGRSAEQIMSRVIEFSDHDARRLLRSTVAMKRVSCLECSRM
jgi:hypothetical protein